MAWRMFRLLFSMTLEQQIYEMGRNARSAARALASLETEERNAILIAMADELLERIPELLEANEKDISGAAEHGLNAAAVDRLRLDAGADH